MLLLINMFKHGKEDRVNAALKKKKHPLYAQTKQYELLPLHNIDISTESVSKPVDVAVAGNLTYVIYLQNPYCTIM